MTAPKTVLVVDDDDVPRTLLAAYFEREGFTVRQAASAAETRAVLDQQPVDLILLDVGLPDSDGFRLAREIRAGSDVGIIFVTAKDSDVDRIVGLEIGADDYVVKPPNLRELLARAKNLMWRTESARLGGRGERGTALRFAGWTLDLERRRLTRDGGDETYLTRGEFEVLATLARQGGRVVTRNQLIDAVSGPDSAPGDRTVDVLISRLRRKLGDDQRPNRLIVTSPGVGYRLGVDLD